MAMASLPPIEVINHPTSHNASVDSILTECGPYVTGSTAVSGRSHDRGASQTGTDSRALGCMPLTSSPARRSSSLARHNPHHQRRGKKGGLGFGIGGGGGGTAAVGELELPSDERDFNSAMQGIKQTQRRSHYIPGETERSSVSIGTGRSNDSRKSHTLTNSTACKESGGRKLLNFFQRGFTPRRPKSMTKGEHRKTSPMCHHASSESLTHERSTEVPIVTNPVEAVRLLDQQISLPQTLIHAFQLDSFNWPEMSLTQSKSSYTTHIRPIDSSLIGPECRHCFQIVSHDVGTLVAQTNTDLNVDGSTGTNSNWAIGHKHEAPSHQTMCSGSPMSEVECHLGRPETELSNTVRTYTCVSATERSRWILYLRRLVHPSLDTERRRENCLHIWIQEAKGLTDKHRYHCEILLDGVTYARTTSKRLTDMLFWGEEFDLSGLPEFNKLRVELWQDSNRSSLDGTFLHRPHTTSPPLPRTATSAPSPHMRPSHTNQTITMMHSPIASRKTTTAMMMSCARGSAELLGQDVRCPGDRTNPPAVVASVDSDHENGGTGHVLRERSANVAASHRPSGPSKSAPVRRRAARRGKLKQHKHCVEAQLVAVVSIPVTTLNEKNEVESWYPAILCDLLNRSKRSAESAQGSGQGKSKGNQKNATSVAQPNSNGVTPTSPIQLRIKTRHRSVVVLPLISYSRLQHHLSQFRNPPVQPDPDVALLSPDGAEPVDAALLLSSLDPWLSVKAKAELAGSVVAFQQAIGQAPQFLVVLILHEVQKQADPNMVLRGNSIATKATEIYLRLVGENYLSRVLADFVQTVLSGGIAGGGGGGGAGGGDGRRATEPQTGKASKQARISHSHSGAGSSFPDCEVDTAKLQSSSQLAQNQAHLIHLVETVWDRIVASEAYFPDKLRLIFAAVRAHLEANFPNGTIKSLGPSQASLSEHVISACLFLRYLCPAILSPSLFGLIAEFPSEPKVLRAFTLVAKTIQSLANFSLFAGSKEVYMTFMNPFVSSQLPAMRLFLHAISSPPIQVPRSITGLDTLSLTGHLDGTVSLSQSICLPPHGHGTNRTLLTSHSHHGAFLGDPCAGDGNSFTDPSLLTRSISGLPSGIQSDRLVSGTGPDQQTSLTSRSDSRGTSRAPVLLPYLPRLDPDGQPGDHIDLGLCLALCHLQLSEAIQKIPSKKTPPHVLQIKPILEEIDFFLSSGVEPSANWWRQDFPPPSPQSGLSQTTALPVSCTVLTNSMSPSVSAPIRLDQAQTETVTVTDALPSESYPVVRCDRQTHSPVECRPAATLIQSTIVNGHNGQICMNSYDMPRSPSQKIFEQSSCESTSPAAQVVRSRSGSELVRSDSVGPRYAPNHQTASSTQEQPNSYAEVTINSLHNKQSYSQKIFPNNEQIPNPPPYSLSEKESKAVVSAPPMNSNGFTDDSALWTMNTNSHLISVVTAPDVPLSTNLIPVIHTRGAPPLVAVENQSHLAHMYATHSSSSGYQSLRSHDTATTVAGTLNGSYAPNYDYHPVLMSKDGNVSTRRAPIPASSSVMAMSNPLYAFHTPHSSALSPSLLSSPDGDDLPPQDPRSPPVAQAIPMRMKLTTPRHARRHTYVNLANGPEAEGMFSSMRCARRRASITLDQVVPLANSSGEQISPDQRESTLESNGLDAAAPTGRGGSLVQLTSEPANSAPGTTGSIHARSTHRPNSTDIDLARQVTTMHATVEGLDLQIPSASNSLKSRASVEKRTALFQTDSVSLDPDSIRDELDASQARLAEAQARLLANEAERIQLLRAWHNELMKQSQLVTYGTRGPGVASLRRPYESETFTIPRTSATDQAGQMHRRDTVPLTMDAREPRTFDSTIVPSNPTYSLSRTSSRQMYGTRPRMGASLIGTGYHETPGSHIPSNETTIPRTRPQVAWTSSAAVPQPNGMATSGMVGEYSLGGTTIDDRDHAPEVAQTEASVDPSPINDSVNFVWTQPDADERVVSN